MPENNTQILTGDYVRNMTLYFCRDDDVIAFVQIISDDDVMIFVKIISEDQAQIKMEHLFHILTDYKTWNNSKTMLNTRLEAYPKLWRETLYKSWQTTKTRPWGGEIPKSYRKLLSKSWR